jgi:hypothetical protein
MFERYTSDLPAVPDPDYVNINPEQDDAYWLDALNDPAFDDSQDFREMLTLSMEAKRKKEPKAYDYLVERFFERLGAQSFIGVYAVYDEGVLNLDATSKRIGIPYNFSMEHPLAHGEIVGLPGDTSNGDAIEIHLNPENKAHGVTFGHEIGHYFWRVIMGIGEDGYDGTEEDFCTYFGRRMALPEKELQAYSTINEKTLLTIMSRFNVELEDAITALMEIGSLPPRVAIDTYNGRYKNPDYSEKVTRGIFCLHCMQVGGDYGCPYVDMPTPLFDFTDRAWGGIMQACLGEDLHKPKVLSTLTKFYIANEVQLVLFRPGARYESDSEALDSPTE